MKNDFLHLVLLLLLTCLCFQSCGGDDDIVKYYTTYKYVVTAKKTLNIRAEDRTGSQIIGHYQKGDTIITDRSVTRSGWLPVDFVNDKGITCYGYVSKKLVKLVDSELTPTYAYSQQLAQEEQIKNRHADREKLAETMFVPAKIVAEWIPARAFLVAGIIFFIIAFLLTTNQYYILSSLVVILGSLCAYVFFGVGDINDIWDSFGWIMTLISFIIFGVLCFFQVYSFVNSLIKIADDASISSWPVYGYLISLGLLVVCDLICSLFVTFDADAPFEFEYLLVGLSFVFACIVTVLVILEGEFLKGLLLFMLMTLGAVGTTIMTVVFTTLLVFVTIMFLILLGVVCMLGSGGGSSSSSKRGELHDSYGNVIRGTFRDDKFHADNGDSYTRNTANGRYESDY